MPRPKKKTTKTKRQKKSRTYKSKKEQQTQETQETEVSSVSPPDQTPAIPYEVVKPMVDNLREDIQRDFIEYYAPGGVDRKGNAVKIPEHVDKVIRKSFQAKTFDEISVLFKRSKDRMAICLLAKWSRGEIYGPNTPSNLEKRAKTAESLAKHLESKGESEKAASQKERAQEIRKIIQSTFSE